MGQLKPGADLIYERDGNTVYQREAGSDPQSRTVVGWDHSEHEEQRALDQQRTRRDVYQEMRENQLWGNIRRAAQTNPALQDILNRAIMVYHLTRTDKSQ